MIYSAQKVSYRNWYIIFRTFVALLVTIYPYSYVQELQAYFLREGKKHAEAGRPT